ncbi:unnamed protein product [Amoebophrya sp. A120]|nr:unnamed protein product [Amoebophrya sp. A120]|eukprot:GSA120T00012136001.1
MGGVCNDFPFSQRRGRVFPHPASSSMVHFRNKVDVLRSPPHHVLVGLLLLGATTTSNTTPGTIQVASALNVVMDLSEAKGTASMLATKEEKEVVQHTLQEEEREEVVENKHAQENEKELATQSESTKPDQHDSSAVAPSQPGPVAATTDAVVSSGRLFGEGGETTLEPSKLQSYLPDPTKRRKFEMRRTKNWSPSTSINDYTLYEADCLAELADHSHSPSAEDEATCEWLRIRSDAIGGIDPTKLNFHVIIPALASEQNPTAGIVMFVMRTFVALDLAVEERLKLQPPEQSAAAFTTTTNPTATQNAETLTSGDTARASTPSSSPTQPQVQQPAQATADLGVQLFAQSMPVYDFWSLHPSFAGQKGARSADAIASNNLLEDLRPPGASTFYRFGFQTISGWRLGQHELTADEGLFVPYTAKMNARTLEGAEEKGIRVEQQMRMHNPGMANPNLRGATPPGGDQTHLGGKQLDWRYRVRVAGRLADRRKLSKRFSGLDRPTYEIKGRKRASDGQESEGELDEEVTAAKMEYVGGQDWTKNVGEWHFGGWKQIITIEPGHDPVTIAAMCALKENENVRANWIQRNENGVLGFAAGYATLPVVAVPIVTCFHLNMSM